MLAEAASVFSPGDSQGVNAATGSTTTIGRVPRFVLPGGSHANVLIGALIAVAILYLLHRSQQRRGRR